MQAGFRGDQCSERPALWEFILRRPVGGMLYDTNLILLRKLLLINSFSGFTLSLGRGQNPLVFYSEGVCVSQTSLYGGI